MSDSKGSLLLSFEPDMGMMSVPGTLKDCPSDRLGLAAAWKSQPR